MNERFTEMLGVLAHEMRTPIAAILGYQELLSDGIFGEIEQRGIYGETTPDEARALLEEGVEIHPLPILPDERN